MAIRNIFCFFFVFFFLFFSREKASAFLCKLWSVEFTHDREVKVDGPSKFVADYSPIFF